MRELMIEAEYAPFAPDWFLETASRWFTVQKTPCLQTAEAVIGEPTLEALQNAPQLRWLQMTWAGADRYLHGGFPRGVLLTTASGAFGETIAEHAIGMLLALCRRLPAYRGRGTGTISAPSGAWQGERPSSSARAIWAGALPAACRPLV